MSRNDPETFFENHPNLHQGAFLFHSEEMCAYKSLLERKSFSDSITATCFEPYLQIGFSPIPSYAEVPVGPQLMFQQQNNLQQSLT